MHDRSLYYAAEFKALDKTLIKEHRRHWPALVRGMAEFVYKQGRGASFDGRSWQAIARTLYGEAFVKAFKRRVKAK